MIPGDPPPEIPPPGREPPSPTSVPSPTIAWPPPDGAATDDLASRLRRDRRLLLRGPLDDETCTRACAELMLLDGTSSRPVEVLLSSDGGPVAAVTGLLDVLALMRAPVDTRCIGGVSGTAAVVLASGTGSRAAGPSARISLRIADHHEVSGTATDLAQRADEARAARDRLAAHVANATRLTVDEAAAAFDRGEPLTAAAAVDAGIIDEVAHR